jgi:hypothetical protein
MIFLEDTDDRVFHGQLLDPIATLSNWFGPSFR